MIAGSTSQTHQVTQSGTYSVRVTENECSTISDAVTLTAELLTDIPLYTKIYPNPSSGKITIEHVSTSSQFVTISVYNLLGMKIIEKPLNYQGQVWQTKIDMSVYARGKYILILLSDKGHIIKTLTKQ